jgi:spore maturation protein CgeB
METKNVSIAKGLKIKNRLIGEINRLKDIFARENSRSEENPSTVDALAVLTELVETRHKLVGLKAQLAAASSPIAGMLAELAELKESIVWLNSIPTKEGVERISGYGNVITERRWTAALNRERVDKKVTEYQERINELQDEIDNYNARTTFDIIF